MRRPLVLCLASSLALVALVAGGPPTAVAADPVTGRQIASAASHPAVAAARVAFVRHEGKHWVWFGPRSWDAGYGVYGITVLGDRGATLDLGFSSILCAAGATWNDSVANYFKANRTSLRQSGWKLDKVSAIVHPGGFGPNYRRQTIAFRVRNGGTRYRGVALFDYDFTTTVDTVNYCYQRSLAKYARTQSWRDLANTLQRVQNSLAYSGPGVPGEDPDQ